MEFQLVNRVAMNSTTLINLRVLFTCLTVSSIHACAITHYYGYSEPGKLIVYLSAVLALATVVVMVMKPPRRKSRTPLETAGKSVEIQS